MEKPGWHSLTIWNGTNRYYVPVARMHWEHNIPLVVILSKMRSLNLIMRKHQTNPNWETLYKITGLHSIMEDKNYGTIPNERILKRDMITKCSVWSWIGSWTRNFFKFCSKEYWWENWWNLNKICRLNILLFISWFWSLYCVKLRLMIDFSSEMTEARRQWKDI